MRNRHGCKPDPDSALSRARAFFTNNPDEELTYELLQTKFDCSAVNARAIVKRLQDDGLIESVRVIRNRSKGIAA